MVNSLSIIDTKPKFIKASFLKQLGYRLTGEQIPLGERPCKYGILKVANEDNKREVSFCYLFSSKSMIGLILPFPFEFYKKHAIKNISKFLSEKGLS